MKKIIVGLLIATMVLVGCGAKNDGASSNNNGAANTCFPVVDTNGNQPIVTILMEDGGTIKVELRPDIAPNTVANFISLAENKFYDGLKFHRVVKDFVIQAGDPLGNGTGGAEYNIKGEFESNGCSNSLLHEEGVISMARSSGPDSASTQFFIVTGDAGHLDGDYAAFGKVIEGMDVVKKINDVPVDGSDMPVSEQKIKTITIDTKGIKYSAPVKA